MPSHAASAVAAGNVGGASLDSGATPDASILEDATRLVTAGVPLHTMRSGPDGTTPLHTICRRGQYGMLRVLTSVSTLTPEDVEARDGLGRTPLMLAASSPAAMSSECMLMLIRCGADVNAVTHAGETVLHFAATHADRVALLMRVRPAPHTAWVNARATTPLRTALLRAVYYGAKEAVVQLLNAGANPNIPDGDGRHAVDLATRDVLGGAYDVRMHPAIQHLLLTHGGVSREHGGVSSAASSGTSTGSHTLTHTSLGSPPAVAAASNAASSIHTVHVRGP